MVTATLVNGRRTKKKDKAAILTQMGFTIAESLKITTSADMVCVTTQTVLRILATGMPMIITEKESATTKMAPLTLASLSKVSDTNKVR